MTDHRIEIVTPLYDRTVRQAVCVCSWTSETVSTPGQATIAGWTHLVTTRKEAS